jgi:L-2-hydroxyglutarate oxidase LhgO
VPPVGEVVEPAAGVAVIGGGVVGCAVAEALARRGQDVLLLESAATLGGGVTSRNSGVIHSGLYYAPGSLKATTCVRGNHLLYEWARRHDVWHRQTGKLVVAPQAHQVAELDKIEANATASGAPGLRRVSGREVTQLEPGIACSEALLCQQTGIVDPHELVLSLKAAAEANGAVFVLNTRVSAIDRVRGSYHLQTTRGEIAVERVVNAAGLDADRIAGMVGLDRFPIYPCRGDYFLLRSPVNYRHLIYPVKDPRDPGLGIHLTLDRAGAYRLGPDAEYVSSRDDFRPAEHKHATFLAAAQRLLGPLRPEQVSYEGCGIRPKLRAPHEATEKDFVLEEFPPGFVNLIGIESPGLTAALALAERVVPLIS